MDKHLMEKVQQLLEKIESNEALKRQFQENPLEAIKALTGVEISAETVAGVSESVKEQLGEEEFSNLVDNARNVLK